MTSGRKANSRSLIGGGVLFDVLDFAVEELVESAEVEHACGLPEEEGGLDGVDLVEHGVVVHGELLEHEHQEVVGQAGLAETVVVDDGVLLPDVVPVLCWHYLSSSSNMRIQRR